MTNRAFINRMSRSEIITGIIYLPIHTVVLPLLIAWHAAQYPGIFTETQYNIAYLVFSFIFVLAMFLRYLRAEFDSLLDNGLIAIVTLIRGFFLNVLLNFILLVALVGLGVQTWANPNDAAVAAMAETDYLKVVGMTIFLGPIIEEVLFRGVIFGSILKRSRLLAYVVSISLFAILHVWQYAVVEQSIFVFIYVLNYIPASFVLAWCYERSGSLWTPIIFHMGINLAALALINV